MITNELVRCCFGRRGVEICCLTMHEWWLNWHTWEGIYEKHMGQSIGRELGYDMRTFVLLCYTAYYFRRHGASRHQWAELILSHG
jgi:hypothetical protein